jgi:hypothetical protein
MRRRLAIGCAIVAGAGCRQILGIDDLGGGDGSVDGAIDGIADGAIDAEPLGPWGAPTPIVDLNTAGFNDDDPSLTDDLLELFFASDRPGGLGARDIWVATRATVMEPWSVPSLVMSLSSTAIDSNHHVTGNGLAIIISSMRTGGAGGADLYLSTRTSRASPWSAPMNIAELNSPAGEWMAFQSASELRLLMCSSRAGNEDIYESSRVAIGADWQSPVVVVAQSTGAHDCDAMTPDDTSIYLASTRVPGEDYDLFFAADPLAPAVRIDELSTPNRDRDPWVTPDHRTMYFSSNRTGDDDLYVATR